MSYKDILNERRGYDPAFGDSMNPNQGWQRSRPSTLASVKIAGGRTYTRETGNDGVTFKLDWKRRNLKVTERLQRFFRQFEQGCFTFIDHDSSRQYVGRFVGDEPQSFEVNGRFSSTGWTFQELPGMPMLEYPADFDRWGIRISPINDFGEPYAAADAAAPNAWSQPLLDDGNGNISSSPQLKLDASSSGDRIAFEYRGYGFRLNCAKGPGYGEFRLLVDGVLIQNVDCFDNSEQGVCAVYEETRMPLDIHLVEIISTGSYSSISTTNGTALLVDSIEVLR